MTVERITIEESPIIDAESRDELLRDTQEFARQKTVFMVSQNRLTGNSGNQNVAKETN